MVAEIKVISNAQNKKALVGRRISCWAMMFLQTLFELNELKCHDIFFYFNEAVIDYCLLKALLHLKT